LQPIRTLWVRGHVFTERHRILITVCRAGGGVNDTPHFRVFRRQENRQSAFDIDPVGLLRMFDRMLHARERRSMKDKFSPREQLPKPVSVENICPCFDIHTPYLESFLIESSAQMLADEPSPTRDN